jgi:hypothetical protein
MKKTFKILGVLATVFVVVPVAIGAFLPEVTPEQAAQRQEERERDRMAKKEATEKAAAEKEANAQDLKIQLRERVSQAMNETLSQAHVNGARWSWEQTSGGWLAVTVEIPEDDAYKARTIGTKGVVAVRNQFYQQKIAGLNAHAYRVTVNGPNPGPDMIARYGSARLNGGQVNWESGLQR